jgi:hypothetical protein
VWPSCSSAISGTVRGLPVFRPVVVSTTTGIPLMLRPTRPPLSFSSVGWTMLATLNRPSFRLIAIGTILPGCSPRCTGKKVVVPEVPDVTDDADAPQPQAEARTTEDAAGAPAGDRDLDELLDDPDPSSA